MRTLIVAAAALALAACASQETAPAKIAAASAPSAAKAPQCWSGDHGKFFNVGEQTTISGVEVACEKTSDGKSGQWMGRKS